MTDEEKDSFNIKHIQAFDKTQNYSNEIYTVSKVIKGNAKNFTIPRYKLIDSEGNVQKNTFALSKLLVIP